VSDDERFHDDRAGFGAGCERLRTLTTGRYSAVPFLHDGVQGVHRAVDVAEKIAVGVGA